MSRFMRRAAHLLCAVLLAGFILPSFAALPSAPFDLGDFTPTGAGVINTKCPDGGCTAELSGGKKWNPGHYLDSVQYTRLGNVNGQGYPAGPLKAAEVATAKAAKAAGVDIQGVEFYYFWRALYNTGTLDTSATASGFDDDYVAATGYVSGTCGNAIYTNPLHIGIYILDTDYFSRNPSIRAVPDYINGSSTYGPVGPDGVHYGYWTVTGFGGLGSGSGAALYRPSVMAQYKAFHLALANHVLPDGCTVDTSPYIEWIKPYLESSALFPQDYGGGGTHSDSSFTAAGLYAQITSLDAYLAEIYPHTLTAAMTNWWLDQDVPYAYNQTFDEAGSAVSGPDTFGEGCCASNQGDGLSDLTQGQAAYIGLRPAPVHDYDTPWVSGGHDQRGVVPYLATVQTTELTDDPDYGQRYYTPQAIFDTANDILHATHIVWQYLNAGESDDPSARLYGDAADLAAWSVGGLGNGDSAGGVLKTIHNNPVTHTDYPSALP